MGHPLRLRFEALEPEGRVLVLEMFIELPSTLTVYYLDTCVWSKIATSEELHNAFSKYFGSNNRIAVLSYFTLFELSRAPQRVRDAHDHLWFENRHLIWIPLFNDQLIESELREYPNMCSVLWLPVSALTDTNSQSLLKALMRRDDFIKSRDEHLQFGYDEFMNLEQLKKNFSPPNGPEYTSEDAELFAWANVISYLTRHFRVFLKPFRGHLQEFKADRLPSIYMRSLYVFYKYYLHGQSPNRSDFLDYAQVAYAPYSDVYVTERNALNVLARIKKSGAALAKTQLIHLSDFTKQLV